MWIYCGNEQNDKVVKYRYDLELVCVNICSFA